MENCEVMIFYGWWQLAVCSFAFVALFGIWWHIGKERNDNGQVFLAFSTLCWAFSGVAEIWFGCTQEQPTYFQEGIRSVFSLFNSLFILLSLPWFKYLPERLEPIIKSKYWHYIIGFPFLFSLLPTISKMWSGKSSTLISELDVYFAFLTLAFLGGVLWTSFTKRRLAILAYLSLVCIGLTFVAQLYKLTQAEVNLTLFSAIFKTSLIMIFFALALSWVKELTENIIPETSAMTLSLFSKKEKNRFLRQAIISGIPGIKSKPIKLTNGNYDLLYTFAERKINDAEGWLEIKPKENRNLKKTFDINDHNNIKRLISSMLDGIFGESLWSKEQHYIPFKEAFFELSDKRERKIRIRLSKEQIDLSGE